MKKLIATITLTSLMVVACGSEDTSITMPTVADRAEISVIGAWARNSPMAATVGAAYMVITSPVDDELLSITVPEEIAARTELHETVSASKEEGSAHSGTGHSGSGHSGSGHSGHGNMPPMAGGMMTMREVGSIELPAGKMVMLQPGGLHIMLMDLAGPLVVGSSFTATLDFAVAGPLEVIIEVRDTAP